VADFIDKYILYYSPLNAIEEMLEFTAATLFLCAFVLNPFEVNDHHLLGLVSTGDRNFRPGKALRLAFHGFVVSICALALGIGTVYRVKDGPIIAQKGYRASVFADVSDGLDKPDGLVYSPNPGLFVANGKEVSNILVFDRKGQGRIFADSRSGLVSPEGMAIWGKSLFIADDSTLQVLRYDETGTATIVAIGNAFKSPDAVTVDSKGNLYIADEKLAMVIRLAGDRREILASSLDGLASPEEMAFDDRGNLYVTDEIAQAVFKISPTGKTTIFADRSRGLKNPEGITFHKGRIYVTDSKTGVIFRFNPDGSGGKLLTFAKKYRGLSGIAFDDRDNLYVVSADPNSHRGYIFRIEPERESPAL
jgi:sugar lactone lactonase YvrE